MKADKCIPISEELLRRIAYILGDSSAAAMVITDGEERKSRGETVSYFESGNSILVRGEQAGKQE